MSVEPLEWMEGARLWTRNEEDRADVREIRGPYGRAADYRGKRVLDLGGHIGGAALLFLDAGADRVVTVEPDPGNRALLRENLSRHASDRHEVLAGALAPKGANEVTLYVAERGSRHATHPVRGRPALEVPAFSISQLLVHRPDVVKVDVEGAEYALIGCEWPSWVRTILMEVHLQKREWRERAAPDLVTGIEAQGFARKVPARGWHFPTTSGWPIFAVWHRTKEAV